VRLMVVGSDYTPTMARLTTASAERELHCKPQFVNLVEIISPALARKLKTSAGHEMPRELRGSVTILQGSTRRYGLRRAAFAQALHGDLGRKRLDTQGGEVWRVPHE
jgi:hypothetical protein